MLSPILPFGEYAPDQPDLGAAARLVKNCIPQSGHYAPFHALAGTSNALNGAIIGAYSTKTNSSDPQTFAGTSTKLYKLSGSVWDDVSKAGDYSTSSGNFWRFAAFGERIIATNYTNAVQSYIVGTSTDFADLGGSPPKARDVAIINEFVVLANTEESGTAYPRRVRWSGINNPTSWTASAATQSDFQDLLGDGGINQRILGFQQYGLIFQERAIWRMNYQGSPLVFSFEIVENARGTRFPNSVVADGSAVYYLAQDGFYVFDGAKSVPIGEGKVDEFVLNDINLSFVERVIAAVDPSRQIICWLYQSVDSGTVPNKLVVFHKPTGRWTLIEQNAYYIWSALSQPVSIDALDAIYPSGLDSIPISLDAAELSGGTPALAAFDSTFKSGYFNGTQLTATLTTAEAQLSDGFRAVVTGVIPIVQGGVSTVTIKFRNLQSENVSASSTQGTSSITGEAPFLVDARYHRAEVELSGAWQRAIGVRVRFEDSGGV